jgi:hypothetical protein
MRRQLADTNSWRTALLLLSICLASSCQSSRDEHDSTDNRAAGNCGSKATQPGTAGSDTENAPREETQKRLRSTQIVIPYKHEAPAIGLMQYISDEAIVSYSYKGVPTSLHVMLEHRVYTAEQLRQELETVGVASVVDADGCVRYRFQPRPEQ